jgi:hypothetical protein
VDIGSEYRYNTIAKQKDSLFIAVSPDCEIAINNESFCLAIVLYLYSLPISTEVGMRVKCSIQSLAINAA